VEKRSGQKVLEEHEMKKKSTKSRLQSAHRDYGVPQLVDDLCTEWSGLQNEIEECQSRHSSINGDRGVLSQWRTAEMWRGGVRSAEWIIGATIQTEERQR